MNKILGIILLSSLLSVGGSHVHAEQETNTGLVVSGVLTAGFGLSSLFCFLKARKVSDVKRKRALQKLGALCAVGGLLSGTYFCCEWFKKPPSKMELCKAELLRKYADPKSVENMVGGNFRDGQFIAELDKEIDRYGLTLEEKLAVKQALMTKIETFGGFLHPSNPSLKTRDIQSLRSTLGGFLDEFKANIKGDEEKWEVGQTKGERERALEDNKDFDEFVVQLANEKDYDSKSKLLKNSGYNEREWIVANFLALRLQRGKTDCRGQMIDTLKHNMLGNESKIGAEARVDRMINLFNEKQN